jgi:parallel beta-helix repeat protein
MKGFLNRRIPIVFLCLGVLCVGCSGSDDTKGDTGDTGGGTDGDPEGCKKATAADLPQVVFDAEAKEGCHWTIAPGENDQDALQSALVEASEGSVICLTPGTFNFHSEIYLKTSHLTIKGAGRDETILDFSGQIYGANGINNRGDYFTIRDLTVLNTRGDGIRATSVRNVAFINVAVIWEAEADTGNGAYGIYPVQSQNVLVDNCYVQGASDAGIYVGQSKNIIVKNNEAFGNVAGIEIENSTDADVYGNHTHGNTGGLLIFDLPNHPVKDGKRTRAHDNLIEDNNLKNFAPSGVVKNVPPGTGIIVLASDNNEIYGNTVKNNSSLGIVLIMYHETIFGSYKDEAFDPYCDGNYVHDNTLENNGAQPQSIAYALLSGTAIPNLAWGGCVHPDKDGSDPAIRNCFENNDATDYIMFNLCGEEALSPEGFDYDIGPVSCSHEKLPQMADCWGLAGCNGEAETPVAQYVEESGCEIPYARLSDYGFFEGPLKDLKPVQGVLPYSVNSPLWADHAGKGRFIVLPDGETIGFDAHKPWSFPKGSIIIKNFFFDLDRSDGQDGASRLIETRLLIKGEEKWSPEIYVWDSEQSDATYVFAGAEVDVEYVDKEGADAKQVYLVPSAVQCGSCHEKDDELEVLGLVARQINKDIRKGDQTVNQLAWLSEQGAFENKPPSDGYLTLVDPYHSTDDIDAAARSWMDANCAHCHRDGGAAGATALFLSADEDDETKLGICKSPIAAGSGAEGLEYDIVPGNPDASIMVFRIASTDPEVKMPEIPNLQVDEIGLQLIVDWIQEMPPKKCGEE